MYLIDVRGAATTKLNRRGLLKTSAAFSTVATFPSHSVEEQQHEDDHVCQDVECAREYESNGASAKEQDRTRGYARPR
jgi:hypothetical protein